MKTFGTKIKEARLQKGLTQKQLASQLSIRNTTLNNWEQDRNKPDLNYIEMLCSLLDVTPDYFFEIGRGKSSISSEENALIEKFRLLSPEGKKVIAELLDSIVKYEKNLNTSISANNRTNIFPTSYIITPLNG